MKALVLDVPGVHLGSLGCYGAEWVSTPTLDRLAAEGVVFDQHLADCPHASVPSSWSGRYAFPAARSTNRESSLPAILEKAGVPVQVISAGRPVLDLEAQWSSQLEAALAAMKRLRNQDRCLVWVELSSLAPPWRLGSTRWEQRFPETEAAELERTPWTEPPVGEPSQLEDEEVQRLQDTYSAVVETLDTELADWLTRLEEWGGLKEMALWFTGGSGLALAEHGLIGLDQNLHEESVHLPLLVRLPDQAHAGLRVGALTQPVDLFPTLLESCGVPVPGDAHGRSLWPLVHGEAEQLRAYACAALPHAGKRQLLLRTLEWALLLQTEPGEAPLERLLFVKPDDRWEVNNLVQLHEHWAEHLEQTVQAFVEASRRPGPLEAPPLRDWETVAAESVPVSAPDSNEKGPTP